ncbi:Uma2 family endonuclease [Trichocoleus sp. FACHB-90]|uniref:Uma2 family endonuclease n=1 Tax=Cyanophyceae TaxID=3028117 RepID=UPI001688BCD7|nr:Uma2 family endonuclease [Trichocoleus sp. FACHB-90]MBD1925573.1 Uma2 family endonuclease [Trichocoleus sp. FACHB-90]
MINVIVKPDAIELPAGAVVRVPGTWQDYQAMLEHLGDRTSPRIKYRDGELLLMVPLPEHGKQLDIIVDMVKVLLRHRGLRFDSYHETTMDLPEHSGVIPDHFFYIGELPVVGKRRIDWSNDPPPNLAIECDITSFTSVNDYLPYRVSELWSIRRQKIEIYQFQDERYILVQQSQFFGGFDLNAIFTECISDAYQLGSGAIDKLSDRYPRQC